MKQAPNMWFLNAKIVNAINLCMEMIAKAGLTESDAEYVPACLYQAIKASNQISRVELLFAHQNLKSKKKTGATKLPLRNLGHCFFNNNCGHTF